LKIKSPYRIEPDAKLRLSKLSTNDHDGFADKTAAEGVVAAYREQLAALQQVFYASQAKSLLIVLQGMDTAGKDGVISHIFSGINPQGCDVSSFKVPTPLELRHNFLWRCQAKVPARGMIGIFNRSHYEDVLSPRVHGRIDKKTVHERFNQINNFEKSLADNDSVILKFFLHISRKEQTERLQSRIDDPEKYWKLSPADFEERPFWPKYMDAYQDILRHTSQKNAPWFVIPSDHKWYRNAAISAIIVDAMHSLKLKFPDPAFDPTGIDLDKIDPKAAAKKVEARVAVKS
jgi:PPK2 family polyphosphate:nucleotide phosphotransferase